MTRDEVWRAELAVAASERNNVHKEVMALFPQGGDSPRQQFGVLWVPAGDKRVRVQSLVQPTGPTVEAVKHYVGQPTVGSQWAFKVEVNPTVHRTAAGRGAPRESLLGADFVEGTVAEWFVENGERWWGFAADEVVVEGVESHKVQRRGRAFRLDVAVLSGVLRVVDTERFSASCREGIGRGRAWGCGLLLCRPATT